MPKYQVWFPFDDILEEDAYEIEAFDADDAAKLGTRRYYDGEYYDSSFDNPVLAATRDVATGEVFRTMVQPEETIQFNVYDGWVRYAKCCRPQSETPHEYTSENTWICQECGATREVK